jgi:hypothetical protein
MPEQVVRLLGRRWDNALNGRGVCSESGFSMASYAPSFVALTAVAIMA